MLDEIILQVIGGSGGNGAVSFRRARYEPRGGPDGGDGGKGGAVVVEADPASSVLDALQRKRVVRADAGGNGSAGKKHGRNGKDIVLHVPLGTVIWKIDRQERVRRELIEVGDRIVVARGGKGGRGNGRMATSTRRQPGFAERGLEGDTIRLRLEVRLLADVGFVGLPNAGKSSLLRAMTAARPKVGAYPFTTLAPHLGVAEIGYERLVLADVPGLAEGATEGIGLGADFLRHAERTRVLLYVVDASRPVPGADIEAVRREVMAFGHGLEKKHWLVALNKIDLPGVRERAEEVAAELRQQGHTAYLVSALTGEGVDPLLRALFALVQGAAAAGHGGKALAGNEEVTLQPRPAAFEVRRVGNAFHVVGPRPQEAVEKLGVGSAEAKVELVRRLRRMGVVGALRRSGIADGDRVRIGAAELEWPL
jgi:GTP-binding protein